MSCCHRAGFTENPCSAVPPLEPGAQGQGPVAFDRRLRDTQGVRGFLNRQSTEETQFYDLCLLLVELETTA